MSRNRAEIFSPSFDITATDLSVSVNGEMLLEDINLTIQSGEYVAINGESGSGKTSLANTLIGLAGGDLKIESGGVKWGNVDLYTLNEEERTRLRGSYLGYVPQSHNLIEDINASANVQRPHLLMGKLLRKSSVRIAAETLGVSDKLDAQNTELSGGQKQRINILRGIVGDPGLILLDEPTSSQHQEMKEEINRDLEKLVRTMGKTVIVVTHEATTADRLITLASGRVVADNTRLREPTTPGNLTLW